MADIALNDWINFKDKMARLSQTAADKFTAYINSGGGYANMDIEDIVGYATALVQKYGEGSGTLAAMMYDAIAELSGAAVPPAEIAELPSYGDVAKAIQGAAKTSELSEYLGAVAGRLVKQVGADTTLKNAERDGAQFAWIPMGDTCAFCITLASRGWQYISKKTLKNGHAEHIHANCDCQYAVRFDKNTNIEGYDPDKYKKMYYDADGNTPKERINAMRRDFYAQNKANGLKNLESSAAEEFNVGGLDKIFRNKYGQQITFANETSGNAKTLKSLINEYDTRLMTVESGAEKAAGDVDMSGAKMRLSTKDKATVLHEFAHTLANTQADKFGLTNDADFWKEIQKVRRQYMKSVENDPNRWISSYEHSFRGVGALDEFVAEAFAQAKAKEMGIELPKKYGNDFTFSKKVLDIVNKYFKK